MARYEQVTYRPAEGARHRSILLEDPRELEALGGILTGTQVAQDGSYVGDPKVSRRDHVISRKLVLKRIPMVMNLHYGELEPIACYKTLIPRHDYQDTATPGVSECSVCHRRISVEVVPF